MKTKMLFGILVTTFFFSCLKPVEFPEVSYAQDPIPKPNSKVPKVAISWPGTYTSDMGIILKISDPPLSDNLKFELVQTTPACMESVHGVAKMIKSDMATYTQNDSVVITLIYKLNEVDVSEVGFTHASPCVSFGGVYVRNKPGI